VLEDALPSPLHLALGAIESGSSLAECSADKRANRLLLKSRRRTQDANMQTPPHV